MDDIFKQAKKQMRLFKYQKAEIAAKAITP